jgi:restriction system protein
MKAALEALDRAGGSLHLTEVLAAVASRVALTPYDLKVYRTSGDVRWHRLMHRFSTSFVKAGFIRKNNGRWELTTRGRIALALPADALFESAAEGYRDWKVTQREATGTTNGSAPSSEAAPAGAAPKPLLLRSAEAAARAEIESFVGAMSPYDFQDLVAALLRAMGFTIAFVSGRGTDGGTDILAYPDPLGIQTPHLRVQVKHRADRSSREEIAALRGIIRHGREVGLFVASGGFTSEAVREARHGAVHIELMDWDGLLAKWLAHYHRMLEEDRKLLKIRPVHYLAAA